MALIYYLFSEILDHFDFFQVIQTICSEDVQNTLLDGRSPSGLKDGASLFTTNVNAGKPIFYENEFTSLINKAMLIFLIYSKKL